MIVLKDVSKIYQIGDTTVHALDHANMHIKEGEFVSIIGPSGSGKSTMMNIIGCLDTADEGQYLLDGQPIENYSERELAQVRSRKLGFIFQSFNLIGNMTAAENVELPIIYQKVPKEERKERVYEALKRVKLEGRAKHRPGELSGGQQQRVAIARAIATRCCSLRMNRPEIWTPLPDGKSWIFFMSYMSRDTPSCLLRMTRRWQNRRPEAFIF